jgi:hypothetical protein
MNADKILLANSPEDCPIITRRAMLRRDKSKARHELAGSLQFKFAWV